MENDVNTHVMIVPCWHGVLLAVIYKQSLVPNSISGSFVTLTDCSGVMAGVESLYQRVALGLPTDEYGEAAKVWDAYIGCIQTRTQRYKTWLVDMLMGNEAQNVLDVACGTG